MYDPLSNFLNKILLPFKKILVLFFSLTLLFLLGGKRDWWFGLVGEQELAFPFFQMNILFPCTSICHFIPKLKAPRHGLGLVHNKGLQQQHSQKGWIYQRASQNWELSCYPSIQTSCNFQRKNGELGTTHHFGGLRSRGPGFGTTSLNFELGPMNNKRSNYTNTNGSIRI